MTPAERNYGAYLLLWARTLEQHRIADFETWLVKHWKEQKAA